MAAKDKLGVLVVDDDVEILDTLAPMMERRGWKCYKAPTGEIALDAFRTNQIDIVVLDLQLPRVDGFTVLKEMKGLKPNIPVIILTGVGYAKEEVDKALKLGAAGYVGKAMPIANIIATINKVLGQ